MKTQNDIHQNPDWQTIGPWAYNVAAPSGRILHALAAMRVFEKRKGMGIYMGAYRDKDDGVCYACCGGASRSAIEGWLSPKTFMVDRFNSNHHVSEYEESLDYFKSGQCEAGFYLTGIDEKFGAGYERVIRDYDHSNTAPFYTDMKNLASDLAKAGW